LTLYSILANRKLENIKERKDLVKIKIKPDIEKINEEVTEEDEEDPLYLLTLFKRSSKIIYNNV